jgi:hypothetical protein
MEHGVASTIDRIILENGQALLKIVQGSMAELPNILFIYFFYKKIKINFMGNLSSSNTN